MAPRLRCKMLNNIQLRLFTAQLAPFSLGAILYAF